MNKLTVHGGFMVNFFFFFFFPFEMYQSAVVMLCD